MSATTDEFAEELRQHLEDTKGVGGSARFHSISRSGSVLTVKVPAEAGPTPGAEQSHTAATRTITVT